MPKTTMETLLCTGLLIRSKTLSSVLMICLKPSLIYTDEMSKTLLDGNGHTCMHFAAKRGEVEVLEELHAAGANFSTPSR